MQQHPGYPPPSSEFRAAPAKSAPPASVSRPQQTARAPMPPSRIDRAKSVSGVLAAKAQQHPNGGAVNNAAAPPPLPSRTTAHPPSQTASNTHLTPQPSGNPPLPPRQLAQSAAPPLPTRSGRSHSESAHTNPYAASDRPIFENHHAMTGGTAPPLPSRQTRSTPAVLVPHLNPTSAPQYLAYPPQQGPSPTHSPRGSEPTAVPAQISPRTHQDFAPAQPVAPGFQQTAPAPAPAPVLPVSQAPPALPQRAPDSDTQRSPRNIDVVPPPQVPTVTAPVAPVVAAADGGPQPFSRRFRDSDGSSACCFAKPPLFSQLASHAATLGTVLWVSSESETSQH